MTKIGETIVENGIKEINELKERTTVRGIRIKGDTVFMLYSKLYNDYTFPGGGVKEDENKEETLKRELLEEVGIVDAVVLDNIGYTVEYRYGISGSNSIYKQVSHYFLYEAFEFVEPTYFGREKKQGLSGVWVNIDEVIDHNKEVIKSDRTNLKGYQTVLIRENQVLNYIKETLL